MKGKKLALILVFLLGFASACGGGNRDYSPESVRLVDGDAPSSYSLSGAPAPEGVSADVVEAEVSGDGEFRFERFSEAPEESTAYGLDGGSYDWSGWGESHSFIELHESEASDVAPASAPMRPMQSQSGIRARLMTAGEWNDNENHDFLLGLMQSNSDFRRFEQMWRYNLSQQIKAVVMDSGRPINNALVELLDANENVLFSARTNNDGEAYMFVDFVSSHQGTPAFVRATSASSQALEFSTSTKYEFDLPGVSTSQKMLDLMFVIDVTGSMGDELEYLKVELTDIIRQVNETHANINIRLSVLVYRDVCIPCCDFTVRTSPFTTDIDSQIRFLEMQYADGGGDWEEAVEIALAEALEQDWRDDAYAKLMFLVLDAPPHNRDYIRDEMHRVTMLSANMGIRIIPVAASGIDTVTEFLMRALSAATGGTYVFITGHSGIGYGHIEPTIGDHEIQLLNELLVNVINRYLE